MMLELQPVILAAGEGSRLFPLTDTIPKCLLPIGNKPMIWYPLHYLERYGFQDFMVIVRKGESEKIKGALQSQCMETSRFQYIHIEDDDDIGTAESLTLLKGKTKVDLLIVSSDMVTDLALHRLVDTYRKYDATLCCALTKRVDVQTPVEQSKPTNKKSKNTDPFAGTRDIVSIDPKENRLLYLANEADLEHDTITFRKSLLKRYPKVKIQSSLVDAHLYIMKNWLVDYLADNSKFESFKSDFIPHVIRKQFSKAKTQPPKSFGDSIMEVENDNEELTSNKLDKDIFSYTRVDDLISMTKEWSGYQGNCLKDPIKCYAYVSEEFCLRVNTIPSYTFMNRQILKMKDTLAPNTVFTNLPTSITRGDKTQIGNDCLIGDSTTIENKVTIKKSMIGKSCTIGSDVRITNSVIMDHVTIADGSTIQNCVICDHCFLGNNCSLTNCQVSGNQKVQDNTDLKGQFIAAQEMEFDSDEGSID